MSSSRSFELQWVPWTDVERDSSDNPNIVRSVDGVHWVDIDVSFDDTVAQGSSGVAVRSYDQLIQTESGYALLMTTAEFQSEGDRSDRKSVV